MEYRWERKATRTLHAPYWRVVAQRLQDEGLELLGLRRLDERVDVRRDGLGDLVRAEVRVDDVREAQRDVNDGNDDGENRVGQRRRRRREELQAAYQLVVLGLLRPLHPRHLGHDGVQDLHVLS